jgi:hypothetical protein
MAAAVGPTGPSGRSCAHRAITIFYNHILFLLAIQFSKNSGLQALAIFKTGTTQKHTGTYFPVSGRAPGV